MGYLKELCILWKSKNIKTNVLQFFKRNQNE